MPPPSERDVKGVGAASGASCITRPTRPPVVSARPVVFPLVPVASIPGSGDNLGDATQTCRAIRTPLRDVTPMRWSAQATRRTQHPPNVVVTQNALLEPSCHAEFIAGIPSDITLSQELNADRARFCTTRRPFGLVHSRILLTMHSHITTHPIERAESDPNLELGGLTLSPSVHVTDEPIDIVGATRNMCAIVAYVADVLLVLAVGRTRTVAETVVEPKPPLSPCGVVPR